MLSQPQEAIQLDELSDYVVKEVIGEGGMGKVYLAEDTLLRREVAIKVKKYSDSNDVDHQLIKEARALAKLNHPNIVQVLGVEQLQQEIALVMEYVKGKNLQQVINESQPTLIQKIKWLLQIAKGLNAAHNKGYLHCDLKLTNILIDEYGNAKIADFGIARFIQDNNPTRQSYLSVSAITPELIEELEVDKQSDLFALGVLAFELFSARKPFKINLAKVMPADNQQRLFLRKCLKQPESANAIFPQLSPDLARLIDHLLQYEKGARIKDCATVISGLSHILLSESQKNILQEETMAVEEWQSLEKPQTLVEWKRTFELTFKTFYRYQFWLWLLLFIFSILMVMRWFAIPVDSHLRVAIVKPVLQADDSIPSFQQSLVLAALESGLRDFVVETENMRLLESEEAKSTLLNSQEVFKTTGASDIIMPKVSCLEKICQVEIEVLSSKEKSVWARKQWPIFFKSHREIYDSAKVNLASIFGSSSTSHLHEFYLSEQEFAGYLRLYHSIRYSEYKFEPTQKALWKFIRQHPYVFSAYGLARELSLNHFEESNDNSVLTELLNLLNHAPQKYRASLDYQINLFWIYLNIGNQIKLDQTFSLIQEQNPDLALMEELSAVKAFSANEFSAAINHYHKAIQYRPSSYLFYNLALTYWWAGETKQSIAMAEKVVEMLPNDYKANRLLGSLYLFTGKVNEAILSFETVLQQSPQSIDQNNLAVANMLLGNYVRARELARELVDKQPDNATWLINFADTQYFLGDKRESSLIYEHVIELNKEKADVQSLLETAQAYVHLERTELALKTLSEAKAKAADNLDVYYVAAIIYTKLGEQQSALFNVNESLVKGLSSVWYNLPWFDVLCGQNKFRKLMRKHANSGRCRT